MGEENDLEIANPNDGQIDTVVHDPEVDRALSYLVFLAENGIEVGVTLFTAGTSISGTIVGGKKYFDSLIRNFRGAPYTGEAGNIPDLIADAWASFRKLYVREVDFPSFDPAYIHLADIKWAQGNHLASATGLSWRGKLSSVDGFIFGQLNESLN